MGCGLWEGSGLLVTKVNREFTLVAACCQWPPSPQRDTAIADAATVDWARFLKVVNRHRVSGLVWNGLTRAGIEIPPDIAEILKTEADRTTRSSLALCAETIRLQGLFDRAELTCAFVKGVTLAVLAYGNLGIRHAKDIDMIVKDADLRAVGDLLATAGYRRQKPPGAISEAQLVLWRSYGKDMEWRHEASGIELELHWRLSNISFLLREPIDFAALRPVAITPAAGILTLPAPDLFVYLCVHGAAHGWCRLKWLADVHALIADRPDDLIENYYRLAKTKGAERAVGQALLLCADLFGLRLPVAMAAELRDSRAMTVLARLARLCMTRGNAEIEIYDLPFGTTLISASHLLLAGGLRDWGAEIARKAVNLEDVLILPLPRSLGFLYWFLRGPLWLFRRVSNGWASPVK